MTLSTLTPDTFGKRISHARKGDRVVYHTGLLMYDRLFGHPGAELDAIALAAWRMYEAGAVTLVQRKISDGNYEYMAVVK